MNKKISVIIVAYNSQKFIEKCISQVLKNLPQNGEIIVLDNASVDKTVQILEEFLPKITLIESRKNLGFAKGNNLAAKKALGEYLFFLNPDTEIKGPTFEDLIDFYERTPDSGIIGPRLVMPNGEIQSSVMKLPTIWGAMKEFILGIKNSYLPYMPECSKPCEVECVFGAAMLIKKELFWKVGGFDEKFFLYYEDIDLCKRIRELGKKVYYYPKVTVEHIVGGVQSEEKYQLNVESAIKYYGFIKALILNLIFQLHRILR